MLCVHAWTAVLVLTAEDSHSFSGHSSATTVVSCPLAPCVARLLHSLLGLGRACYVWPPNLQGASALRACGDLTQPPCAHGPTQGPCTPCWGLLRAASTVSEPHTRALCLLGVPRAFRQSVLPTLPVVDCCARVVEAQKLRPELVVRDRASLMHTYLQCARVHTLDGAPWGTASASAVQRDAACSLIGPRGPDLLGASLAHAVLQSRVASPVGGAGYEGRFVAPSTST